MHFVLLCLRPTRKTWTYDMADIVEWHRGDIFLHKSRGFWARANQRNVTAKDIP